jgi:hypothetical protein
MESSIEVASNTDQVHDQAIVEEKYTRFDALCKSAIANNKLSIKLTWTDVNYSVVSDQKSKQV